MSTENTIKLVEQLLPIALGTIKIGIEIATKLQAMIERARAEGRDITPEELAAAAADTRVLRDQADSILDRAAASSG